MAQPRDYTRQYNFNDYQTTNPSDPLPGTEVDNELNAVKLTLDDLNENIGLVQRDDGKLRNLSVHKDAFDAGALALIGTKGYSPEGDWTAGTSYDAGDLVNFNDATYLATIAHTAGNVFNTDYTAGKWILLANAAINTSASSYDQFEGDGSQTAFTLTYQYSSDEDVLVFVNGSLRTPTDDYSISSNTITFTTAPSTPTVPGTENVIVIGTSVIVEAAKASAQAAATNAEGYRDDAQDWASKTDGVIPTTTEYSSKAHAIGGTGVDTSSGSAKDWATKTSGTVGNTTEYSAKYWATSTDVTTVSSNIADIQTVAGDITNVNNVGSNIADVTNVSDNISDVQDLLARYHISATAPATASAGDLWYNTSNDSLYTYSSGGNWILQYGYNDTTIYRYRFVATANQTVFSGTDAASQTLAFVAGQTIYVYLNGLLLLDADYTIDYSANSITFASNTMIAGDELDIHTISPFSSSDQSALLTAKAAAETAAQNAATSETNAASSASSASTSAATATSQAAAASTSASNAATSESNASTSETNAAASATAAAASAVSASQKWDEDTTNDVLYKGAGYRARVTGAFSGQTGILELHGYTPSIGASPYIRFMDYGSAVSDGNVGDTPTPDDMQWLIVGDDGDNALKFIEGGTSGYYTPQTNDTNWALKINQDKSTNAHLTTTLVSRGNGTFNITATNVYNMYSTTPQQGTYYCEGIIQYRNTANNSDPDPCIVELRKGGSQLDISRILTQDSGQPAYEAYAHVSGIVYVNGNENLTVRAAGEDPDPGGASVNYFYRIYRLGS